MCGICVSDQAPVEEESCHPSRSQVQMSRVGADPHHLMCAPTETASYTTAGWSRERNIFITLLL